MPEDAARFGGNWQCGAGTVCTALATADKTRIALAQCLPPPDAEMYSGLPCLQGEVASSGAEPFKDKYPLTQFAAFAEKASAVDYTCRPPRIGVPGGLAYRRCNDNDRRFASFKPGAPLPPEICGLTGGKAFDICVGTGKFDECLAGAVQRGNRASCSADHFCRDDYICQAFPPGHAIRCQGQRRRLLLADLFHVPDAHRQPHHAVEEPHARRLPLGRGGRRRGAVVSSHARRMVAVLALILGWHAAARAEGVVTFVDDPAILAALETKGYGFEGLFGISGNRRPRRDRCEIAGLQGDRRHGRRRCRRIARRDEGRRAAALRSHRRQCRPRHRHALVHHRCRAFPAGRRRQPARPQGFCRDCAATRDAARSASSTASPMPSRRRAGGSPRGCRSISMPSIRWRRTPMAAAPASPAAGSRSSTRRSMPAGWPAGRSILPS